jgi:hypothetical protein
MLRFRNTLTGHVDEFRPMREGEVGFYYCGPTVWNYGHIGNFRSAIAADILRRYLKFKGYKVTHVMNITDVEDRIIAESQKAGKSIDEYTAMYIDALWEDFDALGCERPDIVPRATPQIMLIDRTTRSITASRHFRNTASSRKSNSRETLPAAVIESKQTGTTRKMCVTLHSGKHRHRKLSQPGMRRLVAVDRAGTSSAPRCR